MPELERCQMLIALDEKVAKIKPLREKENLDFEQLHERWDGEFFKCCSYISGGM